MVFVFHCLAFFTQHKTLQVHRGLTNPLFYTDLSAVGVNTLVSHVQFLNCRFHFQPVESVCITSCPSLARCFLILQKVEILLLNQFQGKQFNGRAFNLESVLDLFENPVKIMDPSPEKENANNILTQNVGNVYTPGNSEGLFKKMSLVLGQNSQQRLSL